MRYHTGSFRVHILKIKFLKDFCTFFKSDEKKLMVISAHFLVPNSQIARDKGAFTSHCGQLGRKGVNQFIHVEKSCFQLLLFFYT